MGIVSQGQIEMLAVIFAAGVTIAIMPIFIKYGEIIASKIRGFIYVIKELFIAMGRNLVG